MDVDTYLKVIIMMNSLEFQNVSWGEFSLGDERYFEIRSGVRLTKNEMIPGMIPFIGASDSNNGITEFISNINKSLDENVLGVNYNGSVVENFYHPYRAIFSDDVKRIKIKISNANQYHYLFLKTIILKQKEKFAYGYKFNGERMSVQKILLPTTDEGQPDWDFVENYMKAKFNQIENDFQVPSLSEINDNRCLNDVEWGVFTIDDLCTIKLGKPLNRFSTTEGMYPYISASGKNNGVTSFVKETNNTVERNVLGVNKDGTSGQSFYHQYNAVFSEKIMITKIKINNPNKYHYLFLKSVILKQIKKYGYGYKFSQIRFKAQKILLPKLVDGRPDFDFMENYMKRIENKVLLSVYGLSE